MPRNHAPAHVPSDLGILSFFVTMPIPHPRRINVKSFVIHFPLGGVLQASWGFMPFLMPFLP